MTPAIAREVCEWTNSQRILSGDVVRVGQHNLLTEEANSRVDGSVMATAKDEADKPEELLHAVATLAAGLRQKSRESRRSVAPFDTPLVPMKTVSLGALKDSIRATMLMSLGEDARMGTLQHSTTVPLLVQMSGDTRRVLLLRGELGPRAAFSFG